MERAPEPAVETDSHDGVWYGWQTLIVDLLSVAIGFAGPVGDEQEFVFLAIGALTLGTPIVHLAHEKVSDGLLSLGVRAGISALFIGSVVVAIEEGGGDLSGTTATLAMGAAILALTAMVAMVCVDAAVLAFTDRVKPGEDSHTRLAPWVDPQRGTYGLSLALAL